MAELTGMTEYRPEDPVPPDPVPPIPAKVPSIPPLSREDRLRQELGFPTKAGMEMYNNLRYCGTCPDGPLLYGDGTCPVCRGSNGVKFEDKGKGDVVSLIDAHLPKK